MTDLEPCTAPTLAPREAPDAAPATPHPRLPPATDGLVERLDTALLGCYDVGTAAHALVSALREAGLAMPSVYLGRAGRLRCYGADGYWRVFDGLAPEAGVLGLVFRTGVPRELRGVRAEPAYLEAVPGVVDEVCVPVRSDGRVIGVLNAEDTKPLPADVEHLLHVAADRFGVRVAELGGVPEESPAQRLVAHCTRLAELTEANEVAAVAAHAAADLAGTGNALVALEPVDGRFLPAAVCGSLGGRLARLGPPELADLEGWVSVGASCHTRGDRAAPDGRPDTLTALGFRGAALLPLRAGGRRLGMLVVADAGVWNASTETVELLELLAAQVAASLRTAATVAELRDRATRDPLTDLGHSAAFQVALATARGRAHARSRRIAVMMIDLDGFKTVNDTLGHPHGDRVLRETSERLAGALRRVDELFRVGGDEFAAVLEVDSPDEALAIGRRLVAAAHGGGATVSIGVAMAEDDEPDASLLARADAALYEVKRSGRDDVQLARTEVTLP